jgi:dTDP-4-dehydrorhamnose 3,5-epimerase
MEITQTGFNGLMLVKPRIFEDNRGYFYESYNERAFVEAGITHQFVQDNQSQSVRGVIRGLHYQLAPYAQTKLVRVLQGEIFDVALDLRKGSESFGKWYGIKLSCKNKLQLLIPAGFAHGFSVMSEKALVLYKTDDYYNKEAERGILYNDSQLKINWQIPGIQSLVSDRDLQLPELANAEMNFIYQRA